MVESKYVIIVEIKKTLVLIVFRQREKKYHFFSEINFSIVKTIDNVNKRGSINFDTNNSTS